MGEGAQFLCLFEDLMDRKTALHGGSALSLWAGVAGGGIVHMTPRVRR